MFGFPEICTKVVRDLANSLCLLISIDIATNTVLVLKITTVQFDFFWIWTDVLWSFNQSNYSIHPDITEKLLNGM